VPIYPSLGLDSIVWDIPSSGEVRQGLRWLGRPEKLPSKAVCVYIITANYFLAYISDAAESTRCFQATSTRLKDRNLPNASTACGLLEVQFHLFLPHCWRSWSHTERAVPRAWRPGGSATFHFCRPNFPCSLQNVISTPRPCGNPKAISSGKAGRCRSWDLSSQMRPRLAFLPLACSLVFLTSRKMRLGSTAIGQKNGNYCLVNSL
jgi:hypothetical protein